MNTPNIFHGVLRIYPGESCKEEIKSPVESTFFPGLIFVSRWKDEICFSFWCGGRFFIRPQKILSEKKGNYRKSYLDKSSFVCAAERVPHLHLNPVAHGSMD
ncbi:hypothetical protein NPIL_591961 [Nephila pilipes]|uniref:Uncharacterized protein n=1 Tax=Nephila pilipes TaxID=299642 RepID=A0A8X6U2G9_NEPPI|nr:hypothetical protein NPIL_591961 [Nephila pilipes]